MSSRRACSGGLTLSVSDMYAPTVSVLMTLYNKGPFVEEAIHSVLENTYRDFELLVVDDGSTDDGVERVGRIIDPRIRLLPSSLNTGRAAAANRGLDEAQGQYLAVLDADDLAHPERLERQVAFLNDHPEIGACGTQVRAIGVHDHVANWPFTDDEARGQMLFEDPMLYGSVMMRSSLLNEHRIRCTSNWLGPGMDYLFLIALAKHAVMANLPQVLTSYRLGSNNFLHGRDLLADRARTFAEAFRVFGIPATQEQVDLHLMFNRQFRMEPDRGTVRGLFKWADHLRSWNRTNKIFPMKPFEARLEHDLARLYYVFADRWPTAALEHLRLSGGWLGGRLMYLLKTRIRSVLD